MRPEWREVTVGKLVGDSHSHEVTDLLQAWSAGDQKALKELITRVYGQLHRLAKRHMAGQAPNHPLQATALIHEAYVRLVGWRNVHWENRARFFAACAQVMRRILVDIARSQRQEKRGGNAMETTLDEGCVLQPAKSRDLVLIDQALTKLAEIDARRSRIVELRFFGGLTVQETAMVLAVSERTVLREWNVAKAWLYQEVSSNVHPEVRH
jgi:RNA polymerase sigma-70 factor (ECF subfamily)